MCKGTDCIASSSSFFKASGFVFVKLTAKGCLKMYINSKFKTKQYSTSSCQKKLSPVALGATVGPFHQQETDRMNYIAVVLLHKACIWFSILTRQ